MYSIDVFIQNYFSLIRTPLVTQFFYILTILFDYSLHFVLIALCVAALVYFVRDLGYSILFLGAVLSGAIIVYVLKIFFNISRPLDGVMMVFGNSFPSGHATVATIFFVMLIYIFDDLESNFLRICFNILCISCIFLLAVSRVYLGVHWVSDVSFGILLGCLVSYASILIFRRVRMQWDTRL